MALRILSCRRFSLLVLWLLSLTSTTQGQDATSTRILFLGNSVFNYRGGLGPPLEGFAQQAGLEFQTYSLRKTPADTPDVVSLDYGRIPLNLPAVAADEKLHTLIRKGRYDFVVLEARRSGYLLPESAGLPKERGTPIPYKENLAALQSLHHSIIVSGAQTVFYVHPDLHSSGPLKHAIAQIYQRFHHDLEKTRINDQAHEIILVPALQLWLDGIDRYGVDGWYSNLGHGNELARYASACLLYTYLSGNDPRQNPFSELTDFPHSSENSAEKHKVFAKPEDAQWIKNQVWLYYRTRPR